MELDKFLEIAAEYCGLGSAVQQQFVDAVYNGEPLEDQNETALEYILSFLQKHHAYLVGADTWIEEITEYRA